MGDCACRDMSRHSVVQVTGFVKKEMTIFFFHLFVSFRSRSKNAAKGHETACDVYYLGEFPTPRLFVF